MDTYKYVGIYVYLWLYASLRVCTEVFRGLWVLGTKINNMASRAEGLVVCL